MANSPISGLTLTTNSNGLVPMEIGGVNYSINLQTAAKTAGLRTGLTANRVIYVDNSGNEVAIPLGANGTILTSSGASTAPSFASPSGTSITITTGTPTGTIDGTNVNFTIPVTPVTNGLSLYLNGLYMTRAVDYTLSGTTLTMITIPQVSDTFTFSIIS